MADPSSIGNPAGFVAAAQAQGMSAAETLAALREAGAGIRTQYFYRVWGEVAADAANRPALAGHPLDVPVPTELHTAWSAGNQPGTFAYQVRLYGSRTVQTERGEVAVSFTDLGTVKSDVPLSPDEAMDQAVADWQEGTQIGSFSGVIGAAALVGAFVMTGRG